MIHRFLKKLPFFGANKGGTSGAGKPQSRKKTEKSPRNVTTRERKKRALPFRHLHAPKPIEFKKFEQLAKLHGSPLTIKIFEHRKKYWNKIKPLELQPGATLKIIQPIMKKIESIKKAIAEGKTTHNTIHLAAEEIETLTCRMVDTILMAEKGKQSLEREFPAKEWNPKFINATAKLWPEMPPELQKIILERLEKEIRT